MNFIIVLAGILVLVTTVFFSLFAATCAHEFGHALAIITLGFSLERVSIGNGSVFYCGMLRGTSIEISIFPDGGLCEYNFSDDKSYSNPWRHFVVDVAGPTAEIMFSMTCFAIVGFLLASNSLNLALIIFICGFVSMLRFGLYLVIAIAIGDSETDWIKILDFLFARLGI